MADLGLSILFSSLIFIVFKLYPIFRVQTPFGIIVNYVVACLVGLIFYGESIPWAEIPFKSWFPGTVFLGMLFVAVFNLMALTSQKMGVSVASVATKMSLVIPVLLGVILYGEALSVLKVTGVLLALAAVYFSSVKEAKLVIEKQELVLPLLVFIGSGIIDSSIKFFEETRLSEEEFPLFSATAFGSAALSGFLFLFIRALRSPIRIRYRNVAGGIALGVPNFFSIYFILRALQNPVLNSASIFTINNVAIVLFTTLLGMLFFRERMNALNWLGIGLAVLSILLVAFF